MTKENCIDELMTEQGRSVKWMLEKLKKTDIDYRKLRRMRRNEQQPDMHEALILAEIFDVQIIDLIKTK